MRGENKMSRFWKNIHPLLRREHNKTASDTNYGVLNAINTLLEEAEEDTIKARLQSSLKTATGEFLDEFGDWFGVYRREVDESDEDYRERIIQAINIPKGTNEAIKWGVRDFLRDHTIGIDVYEPWVDVFFLNREVSRLNGSHHLLGYYYNFAVIDVKIGKPFPEVLRQVINDYKPAGVTLHMSYEPSLSSVDSDEETSRNVYVKYHPLPSYHTASFIQGLNERLTGEVMLSDTKKLNEPLYTSREQQHINSDYRLTGYYPFWESYLHLVGDGGDVTLTDDTHIGDLSHNLNVYDTELYKSVNSGSSLMVSEVRPNRSLYIGLNIDTKVRLDYPKLNVTNELLTDLLEGAYIDLIFSADVGESLVRLETYNFKTGQWDVIGRVLSSTEESKLTSNIDNMAHYLNKNGVLVLRLVTGQDLKIRLDYFKLSYSQTIVGAQPTKRYPLKVTSDFSAVTVDEDDE